MLDKALSYSQTMHVLICLAFTLLHHFSGAEANQDMADMAIMYTITATTVSDCVLPQSVAFHVQCDDDGVVRNLDSVEGLGLATCTIVDENAMICEDSRLSSFFTGNIYASLGFACEGPTDASREATVTLQDDTIDCTDASYFGISSYSRELSMAAVCPPVPGFVSLPMQFQNNRCSEGAEQSLVYSCSKSGICMDNPNQFMENNGPCVAGISLESFSLAVTDTSSFWQPCL